MKKILSTKKSKLNFIIAAAATCFCVLLEVPIIGPEFGQADSFSEVRLDGEYIGCVNDPQRVEAALLEARLQLAKERKEMVLSDVEFTYTPVEKLFGTSMSDEQLHDALYEYLKNDTVDIQRAYMVKINSYTVYLNTIEDVYSLLQGAKEKYDPDNQFQVNITADTEREINMYTAQLISSEVKLKEVETVSERLQELPLYDQEYNPDYVPVEIPDIQPAEEPTEEPIEEPTEEPSEEPTEEPSEEPSEEPTEEPEEEPAEEETVVPTGDGLKEIYFGEKIEIAEAYVSTSQVTGVEEAVEQVTKDQEKNEIYEVQSGDTLSVIANSNGLLVKELLALNEGLSDNTTLQIGDEIVITVPQPELTVMTVDESTYEEAYYAETQYIENDSWYTTKKEVRQEQQAGYHEVTALITSRNGTEESREVINETVLQEPVAEIIEIGTQTPPTYIKPISGGRQSSGFGRRSAPTRGASSYHKGIDWATPIGTAVMASCGGTVSVAGWQSGYGYVVYINHPDGRQTRYGHLSKVLVSVGQKVSQGQKIALSGNTGRSTGPHVHFEIRIGGTAVNPLKYLN